MALARKNRLSAKKDIESVLKLGKTVRNSFLFGKFLKNNLGFSRATFIASKKNHKKAVIRNRVKRIASEQFRQAIGNESVDLVLFILPAILSKTAREIKLDFEKMTRFLK